MAQEEGFRSSDDPGPYTARAGVIATATDSAVAEVMKEITAYRKKELRMKSLLS